MCVEFVVEDLAGPAALRAATECSTGVATPAEDRTLCLQANKSGIGTQPLEHETHAGVEPASLRGQWSVMIRYTNAHAPDDDGAHTMHSGSNRDLQLRRLVCYPLHHAGSLLVVIPLARQRASIYCREGGRRAACGDGDPCSVKWLVNDVRACRGQHYSAFEDLVSSKAGETVRMFRLSVQ